jgi:hypothetical protein
VGDVYLKGSIKCSLSLLWLDTQLGVAGQGSSLPSLTPRLTGRTPEQPTKNATDTIIDESTNISILIFIEITVYNMFLLYTFFSCRLQL